MTRNGKIARLPAALREKLNWRLIEREQGQHLIQWRNSLPQVQSVLKAKFQAGMAAAPSFRANSEQRNHSQS